MSGHDPLDPTTATAPRWDAKEAKRAPTGMTIGIPKSFYVDDLEPDVAKALDDAISTFKGLGVKVVQVDLPDQVLVSAAAMIVLAVEAATYHAPWLRERPDDYGAQVRNRLQNGLAYSAVEYLETLRWRAHALEAHLAAIDKCDAVLAPVSRAVAPTIAETDVGGAGNAEAIIQGVTRFMRPINYLGLPALAVPAGSGQRGLPIGLQLIGRPFNDETVAALGIAFQGATDHHTKVPTLA
jgi:aspartyl-tRNA(Asn)/glutamyl-tRNA(Gln) amidotransferase subunit A